MMGEDISKNQPVEVLAKLTPSSQPANIGPWLKITLLIFLALISVGGLLFLGYKLGQRNYPEPFEGLTPTTMLNPISRQGTNRPLDKTANWKTHTNTKSGYEIKHPSNWQVEEDVNYIGPNRPNYTFFFKKKVEFMPGVSIYVVSSTTPKEWLGPETFEQGREASIVIDDTHGVKILDIPGAWWQEWVFLNRNDRTTIFYASGGEEEISVFNLMLSTFKFLSTTKSEEYCTEKETGKKMNLSKAKEIAQNSECSKEGAFKEKHFCNENTGTWWIDLDIEKQGCNPACVINVSTRQAEINWRCTGLMP